MEMIWRITLHEKMGKLPFKVTIDGIDSDRVVGHGRTPHDAYQAACAKLEAKPWLTSEDV